jgi:hypothetical protein
MNVLQLNLHREYFAAIANRTERIEYRKRSQYWKFLHASRSFHSGSEAKFQKVSKSFEKCQKVSIVSVESQKRHDKMLLWITRLITKILTANYAKYTNPESFRGKCFLNRIFALGTGIFAWFASFAVRLTRVHTCPSVVLKIQSILYIRSKPYFIQFLC